MDNNVLVTSAGRRGELVRLFQNELRSLFPSAKVFAGDMNPALSSACFLADESFELPPVRSQDYIPHLLELCRKHAIRLVVPTIDTELMPLAEHCESFREQGISVVVSDVELVKQCRDKRLTCRLFQQLGLPTPKVVVNPQSSNLPLFARPFDGSCSVDTHVLRCPADLQLELTEDPRMLFTEYLDPEDHEEYTLDLYYDRRGSLKSLVPRLRLETRAGEVSKGRTVRLAEIDVLYNLLTKLPGARGCITVQVFRHNQSGDLAGIEINPRIGGGFPLSYEAGANCPKWLFEEYFLDQEIEYFDGWESNLTMLRYDGQVFVRGAAA
jgi:carbamoyl-phosphate synthase large subunit